MKYRVISRSLHETGNIKPYYIIELQGEHSSPIHNVNIETLQILRSEKDGKHYTVGAEFELINCTQETT
jgi:hypothetical protein